MPPCRPRSDARTSLGEIKSGFSHSVGPPKEPANNRTGLSTCQRLAAHKWFVLRQQQQAHHSWTNLGEYRLGPFALAHVTNLEIAKPNPAINQIKPEDVVDERLALVMAARHIEHLRCPSKTSGSARSRNIGAHSLAPARGAPSLFCAVETGQSPGRSKAAAAIPSSSSLSSATLQ